MDMRAQRGRHIIYIYKTTRRSRCNWRGRDDEDDDNDDDNDENTSDLGDWSLRMKAARKHTRTHHRPH